MQTIAKREIVDFVLSNTHAANELRVATSRDLRKWSRLAMADGNQDLAAWYKCIATSCPRARRSARCSIGKVFRRHRKPS